MKPQLVTMRGPSGVQASGYDDFSLAMLALIELAKRNPGMTWGDLLAMGATGRMSGSIWDKIGNVVKAPIEFVGDKISDAVGVIGGATGSAVRLATDEKVLDGASRLATAYATGGTSEAAGGVGQKIADFFSNMGAAVRTETTGINAASAGSIGGVPVWAVVAGGGVVLLTLLSGGRGRRR